MPQLDKFTYFTQFFWSCLFLFAFYIAICNNRDGLLGIGKILKLRNQLLSRRENKIQRSDPNNLEDLLRKGFSTGVSYMEYSLVKVSEGVKSAYLGCLKLASFSTSKPKNRVLPRFGELSVLRRMERNIIQLLPKSAYSIPLNPLWGITCRKDLMLINAIHSQKRIALSRRV